MKTLYLDCGMGAAGDMLTAALLELISEPSEREKFLEKLNALGIPGVTVTAEGATKCGITGTHMCVKIDGAEEDDVFAHAHGHHTHEHSHDHGHEHEHSHEHEHEHSHDHDHDHDHEHEYEHEHVHDHNHVHAHGHIHGHEFEHAHDHAHHHEHEHEHEHDHEHGHTHSHNGMKEISAVIDALDLSEKVREDIKAVYALIAGAESHVHGVPVTDIHFHEVGTMDALADITAVCMLMEILSPDRVIASAVNVGSGHVHCAHGILPVPAPATAHILRDVPIYGGRIRGELCTPTGAALLRHFADEFADMPVMRVEAVGYGMGKRDFEAANCVRAMLGYSDSSVEEVCELSCNIDDMTGEAIAFACERLMESGALDVYTVPIGMKKSRPAVMLNLLCAPHMREHMAALMLKYTDTLGVRAAVKRRYIQKRDVYSVNTPYGQVQIKHSEGHGAVRDKLEYRDVSRIAREHDISYSDAVKLIGEWISSSEII